MASRGNAVAHASPFNFRTAGLMAGSIVAIFAGLLILFGSRAQVDPGYVGVVSTWGAVDPHQVPLSQGLHLIDPITTGVTPISTQPQNHTFREVVAASRELQNVYVDGGVNYHIDSDRAAEIVTEGGLQAVVGKVFDPAFQDYMKETVPHYSTTEILAQRSAIREATLKQLQDKAAAYGIHVDDLFITNIHFDQAYTDAIVKAAIAQQQLVQAQTEAKTKVAAAQGDADANRLRQQTLTPEQLQYMALQNQQSAIAKWDGKLPTTDLSTASNFLFGPLPTK
jgi:regulator of protease activity HflC (stomatin/prohibitin superfamily)